MKRPVTGARTELSVVIAAEATAVVIGGLLIVAGAPLWVAAVVAVLLAVAANMITLWGLAGWQWVLRVVGWLRHRQRRVALGKASDMDFDGTLVGVLVDGDCLITTVGVWGKAYIPTLLGRQHGETPNTLPMTVIAKWMQRYGLAVDVDVICEGQRTSADSYAAMYGSSLPGPAAGRRTATLVVRLDTRAAENIHGLAWRRDTNLAAAAATCRLVRALNVAGCRAHALSAAQMREAALASVGEGTDAEETYRDEWAALRRPGRGYITSFYFSAEDLHADQLDEVWSYRVDHTTLVVALRRVDGQVRASALVLLTTAHRLVNTPSPVLNRLPGRQWQALQHTMPGAARLSDLPSVAVSAELDSAVVVGPSGVVIGKLRDKFLLMPLSDPAGPTRIALRTNNDKAVRQLIRRAAAVGELVAVYDSADRWTMTHRSSRIWTSRDMTSQPPRPPTLVVHNGKAEPYPGARTSVSVAGGSLAGRGPNGQPVAPAALGVDIIIEQNDNNQISLRTSRFTTVVEAVTFRNEETYLN